MLPRMRNRATVLVLDDAIFRDVYKPFEHWSRALADEDAVELVRAPREEPLPSLEGVTHLIVSGSEASITDDEPWVRPQVELVRQAADAGIAVLGSCYGHQLVALALGGEVGRAAVPELGWIPLDVVEPDPMFIGAESPPWVFASHFDEVTALPPGCVVTARTDRCAIHGFRHLSRPVWGVQSHPEIDPAEGQALLDAFRAVDPRAARADLDLPARDSGAISALIRAFLRAA